MSLVQLLVMFNCCRSRELANVSTPQNLQAATGFSSDWARS